MGFPRRRLRRRACFRFLGFFSSLSLVGAGVLLLEEGSASACQCAPERSFEQEVEKAEVIFLAQPERIRIDGDYVLDATVTRVFKGNVAVASNVVLAQGDCPPHPFTRFHAGPLSSETDRAPMLVYGYVVVGGSGRIIPQQCGRSKAESLAAGDIERLSAMMAPTTTRAAPTTATTTTAPPPVLPDPARVESRPASGCGCVVGSSGPAGASGASRSEAAGAVVSLLAFATVLSRRRAKRI
jgi:hypothetical protein